MASILVTGAAGFIGYHLMQALLKQGDQIVGIDNLNDYYDPQLKLDRLKALGFDGDQVKILAAGQHSALSIQNLRFQLLDLADRSGIEQLFKDHNSISLLTSALKPACATQSTTHTPMWTPIWWVL